VGFIRDPRRYGELRLPVNRRRHQRVSWLDDHLRNRRTKLLRDRWRDLAVLVLALCVATAGFVIAVRDSPLLIGFALGVFLSAIIGGGYVFLSVVDGSLHARLGRRVEYETGMDIRRIPGTYGVVSDVSFEHVNVDHVVLTPHGCLAVEVKSSFSRRQELAKVTDLTGKVAQARDGAIRVQRLLRSRGVDVRVRPVLLFTGPGAPYMQPAVQHGDVTVTAFANPSAWLQDVVVAGEPLDLETARRVAIELMAYREERTRYESSRRQGHPIP